MLNAINGANCNTCSPGEHGRPLKISNGESQLDSTTSARTVTHSGWKCRKNADETARQHRENSMQQHSTRSTGSFGGLPKEEKKKDPRAGLGDVIDDR